MNVFKNIKSIQEITNLSVTESDHDWTKFDGYKIELEDGSNFIFGIDNSGQCCEDFGYMSSDDNFEEYIDKKLISIRVTNDGYKDITDKLSPMTGSEYDPWDKIEGCVFIDFTTEVGSFQLVAYNFHNGYYSHDVLAKYTGRDGLLYKDSI